MSAVRIRYCATCNVRREHRPDTGVIVSIRPSTWKPGDGPPDSLTDPCADCAAWLAGRPVFKAKRPGES